jgi:hypothetical protein
MPGTEAESSSTPGTQRFLELSGNFTKTFHAPPVALGSVLERKTAGDFPQCKMLRFSAGNTAQILNLISLRSLSTKPSKLISAL